MEELSTVLLDLLSLIKKNDKKIEQLETKIENQKNQIEELNNKVKELENNKNIIINTPYYPYVDPCITCPHRYPCNPITQPYITWCNTDNTVSDITSKNTVLSDSFATNGCNTVEINCNISTVC